MKYLFFLLTLLATHANAQTTTRALNWKNIFGRPFVYSGQIKNNKPDGIGYAYSEEMRYKIFGNFKNGLLDGKAVTIDEAGGIFIQTWDKGRSHGPGVWLTDKTNTLYCGNMEGLFFDGRVLKIDSDNEMFMGSMKESMSLFTGRVLAVPAEGNIISDILYEDGHRSGPGYQVEINDGKAKRIAGIWDYGELTDEIKIDHPGFLQNARYHVSGEQIFIFSRLEENQIQDTGYVYDKESETRRLGYFEKGVLKNGLMCLKDGTHIIGSFNENGNEGLCAEYKPGYSLSYGNFKNGELDGEAIKVLFTSKDTSIFFGNFSKGNYSGDGAYLNTENVTIYGDLFAEAFSAGSIKTIKVFPPEYFDKEKPASEILITGGQKISSKPKDISTAINFLLKEFDNGFSNIKNTKKFNPDDLKEVDPFYTENPTTAYKSLYYFPGATVCKIYQAYKQQGFYFGIDVSFDYAVMKKKYDELCRQLAGCNITSLQKGRSMKLAGTITPVNSSNGGITTFYVPAYAGKTRTPKIVLILEYAGTWQLTGRIISYQDIE